MSIKALQDYTFTSKYANYKPEVKRRETWVESQNRVLDMQLRKYPEISEDLKWAYEQSKKKIVLGSQRALQFGGIDIEKNNAKMYNCFDKTQQFVTSEGVKSFSECFDGQILKVLSHDGTWNRATVRNYGAAQVNTLHFKRSSNYFSVKATENHRWILRDGSVTDGIVVGDQIIKQVPIFDFDYEKATPEQKLYWCYGMVYGDGTMNGDYSMVRLCGSDADFEPRFTDLGFKSSSSLSLDGDVICYTGKYQKNAPDPKKDSPELIKAFVAGYLQADGTKNTCNYIQSSEADHIQFIRNCFPIAGVFIVSETDLTGQETNFGVGPFTIKFRIQDKTDTLTSGYTRLIGIEEGKIEQTWCLEVDNAKSFVLPNGTPTGNCIASFCDRSRFFQECLWLLLCGCGTGFSVQYHHIDKLPDFAVSWKCLERSAPKKVFVAEDSIKGWADTLGVFMSSVYGGGNFPEYEGCEVEFDLSKIRPEGAKVGRGRGKAPGPEPLRKALVKMKKVFTDSLEAGQGRFKSIDCYDIIMHASDAVISGGIRRSATICLFSPTDEEMAKAKTGNWFIDNPQRGRSNNSAVLVRDETTFEEFQTLMSFVKQYGEPGFVWVDHRDLIVNPCVEIGFYPVCVETGESGWQACNLCEINGKYCTTPEKFYKACKAGSIIGTAQAGYTNMGYLGDVSRRILEREALLGVSITGMMDNPEVLFDPDIQAQGAKIILEENSRIAKLIGINPTARATCVKPAGTTSCVLGTSSGIHPHHAKRYIRRTQSNYLEAPLAFFKKVNPLAVEKSVWSANGTDDVIAFCVEVPKGAKTKNDIGAIELLEYVKDTQKSWVEAGKVEERCSRPWLSHNVSNTITVKDDEWEAVTEYIYNNRQYFAGISLLSISGDKDYQQAPFTAIYTPRELVAMYGDASVMASGMITDGLHAFENNLWSACEAALGVRKVDYAKLEEAEKELQELRQSIEEGSDIPPFIVFAAEEGYKKLWSQHDWVRRSKQFAHRYFDGDVKQMTYCLKDVSNWKYWVDLNREYKDVDYSKMQEEEDNTKIEETIACAGGSCQIQYA